MVETVSTKVAGRSEQSSKDKLEKARVSYLVRDWQTTDDTSSAVGDGAPGAYLRLGGYGDIEEDTDKPEDFYPRKHIEDAGEDNHATQSVGKDKYKRGIALACSGRALVYAHEKIYINSGDTMDIDSIGDLRINSEGKTTITSDDEIDINSRNKPITINSGPNQNITITAGADDKVGDLSLKAKNSTKEYFGQDLTITTEDSHTYFKANKYSYTQGNTFSIFLGTTFTFTAAFNLTIGANADIYVGGSTTYIKVNSNSITGMTFGLTGMDIGLTGISMGKTGIDIKDKEVRGDKSQIGFVSSKVWAGTKTVASAMGTACANIYSIHNYI